MQAALAVLGNRRMANIGADLKVARLLRALAPYAEPLEAVKRAASLAVVDELPEGAEFTALQEQVLGMRIAEKQTELDNQEIEIEVPLSYALKESDLPKEMTGADGWKNTAQLGAIISDLGSLYLMDG
jgi:hypothetical protein